MLRGDMLYYNWRVKMNNFAKQFKQALNEELKDFNKHVMVHATDDEREEAFHKWIKENPEKAVFKLTLD
jgi:hypothetical protein